jgi:hypothetical protein
VDGCFWLNLVLWLIFVSDVKSVSVLCFFDGLPCEVSFCCLADLDKPVSLGVL